MSDNLWTEIDQFFEAKPTPPPAKVEKRTPSKIPSKKNKTKVAVLLILKPQLKLKQHPHLLHQPPLAPSTKPLKKKAA